MREIGIPFSGRMVRAILDDRKTQTRRMVKPQPPDGWTERRWVPHTRMYEWLAPIAQAYEPFRAKIQYMPGDLLWVKEKLEEGCGDGTGYATYHADGSVVFDDGGYQIWWRWKRNFLPPIFCPREASRINLEVTDARVERLQDITEADAKAEGFLSVSEFRTYWEQLHGEGSWKANHWVLVISFRRRA
jgi:hypothetical protein